MVTEEEDHGENAKNLKEDKKFLQDLKTDCMTKEVETRINETNQRNTVAVKSIEANIATRTNGIQNSI